MMLSHATARIKTTRSAFYALQRAGLCVNGSNPDTITHIFKTVVRPVLLYGLECVYQTKTALHKAEISQAKLLQELVVFRSMFLLTSRANTFYKFLLTQHMKGAHSSKRNIMHRIRCTCDKYDIPFREYIYYGSYMKTIKHNL